MEIEQVIKQVYAQAKLLGACDKFNGTEDLHGIVRLFTSSQGLEFCLKHHFPNLATVRLFKRFNLERYGIYIDAGTITLNDPKRAIIIGRTVATINCTTLESHDIVLFHGAKATVNASKWAVVFVKAARGCSCLKNSSENALIL